MQMKKYKLGEIAEINSSSIKSSDKIDEILYLDTANITENRIGELQRFDLEKAPSRAQRKVKNNTVIFSTVRPNQNHFGIMKNPAANLIVSSGFATLDIKNPDEFSADYLYYNLTQPSIVSYLQTVAQNQVSSYPSVNPSDLANLNLSFPPFSEQKKIASVLSNIDKKISLNNRINAKLEQLAKRIYDYWFVQFDFPDENGKPYKSSGGKMVYNAELKREIPDGWKVGKLSDIANITMGQSPDGTSYNENGDGVIFYQGSTDFGNRFPVVRMYTTSPTRFAKKRRYINECSRPCRCNEHCKHKLLHRSWFGGFEFKNWFNNAPLVFDGCV